MVRMLSCFRPDYCRELPRSTGGLSAMSNETGWEISWIHCWWCYLWTSAGISYSSNCHRSICFVSWTLCRELAQYLLVSPDFF